MHGHGLIPISCPSLYGHGLIPIRRPLFDVIGELNGHGLIPICCPPFDEPGLMPSCYSPSGPNWLSSVDMG